MPTEHRCYLFDFFAFHAELLPLLRDALATGRLDALRRYIETNRERLRDPNEGAPLLESWEQQLEDHDVHQFGDVALTKFYDPTDDLGLGTGWVATQAALLAAGVTDRALLGTPIAVDGLVFDPGKLGSYFQSESEVIGHLRHLDSQKLPALVALKALLERAAKEKRGLYVTF